MELRETAFSYFADLACLIKEDMAPVFNQVMDEILKTMNADDEFTERVIEKTDEAKKFSLDSDSDEADYGGVNVDIN